jgi:peptide deformylase
MAFSIKIVDRDADVRKKSSDYSVEPGVPSAQRLFDDLIEAMIRYNGIGIAAVQVGVLKRVIVIHEDYTDDHEHLVLLNPRLVSAASKTSVMEEGCLSVPGVFGPVERPTKVRVKGVNRRGEAVDLKAKGMLARILQHELDHLEGVLFIDRASAVYDRNQATSVEIADRPLE